MSTVKVFKIRDNAKLPVRAHATDAGADLFFCPENDEPVWLYPNDSMLFQTGLKFEVPEGYMMEIKNKSGVAAKKQLIVGACVVDAGYDGEVFVNLHNIGATPQKIEPGQKTAQAVFIPVNYVKFELSLQDNLNQNGTRGEGALGSTGDK